MELSTRFDCPRTRPCVGNIRCKSRSNWRNKCKHNKILHFSATSVVSRMDHFLGTKLCLTTGDHQAVRRQQGKVAGDFAKTDTD